uniref:Uncharacterized protein n=1 Tax=Cannabis sativa TaxID=3483 RepID=A0A803RBM4_CANSA
MCFSKFCCDQFMSFLSLSLHYITLQLQFQFPFINQAHSFHPSNNKNNITMNSLHTIFLKFLNSIAPKHKRTGSTNSNFIWRCRTAAQNRGRSYKQCRENNVFVCCLILT